MEFKESELQIKKATPKEIYSITVLTRKFFPYTKFNMDRIAMRLKDHTIHYSVALYNGHTVGYVDYKVTRKSVKVMGVAVLEEFQRRGIGMKLLQVPLEYAKEHGQKEVHVFVAAENLTAQHLYVAAGFKFIGKLRKPIAGRDVMLLTKRLVPEKTTPIPRV